MKAIIKFIPVFLLVTLMLAQPALAKDDPYMLSKGTWEQDYDDQWAIKHVKVPEAWALVGRGKPVVVAVIDTGLDWNHQDIDWDNIWENKKEKPGNGKDDDGNGYVDDIIGWDFFSHSNNPFDHDGHGTFVTGVIAAAKDNGVGIAGINPKAKIMVLKALNSFGHTRASYLAKAITYAVDNGAQVINMSVGGKNLSKIEQEAIDYAYSKNVVIIVAAGNEGIDVSGFGPAGGDKVITVASTSLKDDHPSFSNWGKQIDIAAPGADILSLRGRRTDTMLDIPGVKYEAGTAYVGEDKRYYRASGTSFSAPIVTGIVSLMLSNNPNLKPDEVKELLQQTATDVEVPGVDQYTGYGLVNAEAALSAKPGFFIKAAIDKVNVVQDNGGPAVQIIGSMDADQLESATISIGAGEKPKEWKEVVSGLSGKASGDVLGTVKADHFRGSAVWMIRIVVKHKNGQTREARFRLSLG
ncbi:MAG: S8 family serine peptidase [Rhodospirillales bacterium]|nr:S8 family serine peptidase [Rhodospirillales bacterium]MCB9996757.1 S8 family serine peptidase [Rhodospirillales bacterium]